jgi:hypothetical protein
MRGFAYDGTIEMEYMHTPGGSSGPAYLNVKFRRLATVARSAEKERQEIQEMKSAFRGNNS